MIGLVGSGNMARALARGWGEPLLCTDSGSGRAAALAAEVGGEAVESNAELAERAELVVLCHKPYQLESVAAEVDDRARAIVSVLARTSLSALEAAYPGTPVVRVMPNTPVEVRRGVLCLAAGRDASPELVAQVRERFGRLGAVVDVEDRLMDVANAVSGVAPAYLAVLVEAWVDAAVEHGLTAPVAGRIAVESLAGTAELLSERGGDTLSVRREVTSPAGVTARGLAALERAGLRAALADATDAVLEERPA